MINKFASRSFSAERLAASALRVIISITLLYCPIYKAATQKSDTSSPGICSRKMVKYYDTWGSAIRCAEAFIIIDNGYATSPSNLSRLTLESVEHADSLNELRLFRKNSLKIPAIGVCKGFSNDYWTVVFDRAKPSEEPNLGRSVTMNKNYSEIGMVHYDFDLLYLSKPKSGCKDLRKLKNK